MTENTHVETQVNGAIPVTVSKLPRTGRCIVTGFIPAKKLLPRFDVVRREHYSRTGYQREPSAARVNKLANAIEKNRVDLPTAVLLNLRTFDEDRHLQKTDDGWAFNPGEEALYVVDGQHRVEAIRKLYEDIDGGPDKWGDFELPFVCMLGASEGEEMEQFYVVNSNAKSVPTSLAYDLLRQMAESNPNLIEELRESGREWQVKGESLTERLSAALNWRGLIRFPREIKGDTIVTNSGMTNSLKPLLNSSYFGQITTDNQVGILEAYWEGIRRVIPDAFTAPADFAIQKSLGATTMHLVLPTVLEVIKSRNGSVLDADEYVEVLEEALTELEELTPSGNLVEGVEFWRSGGEGAAGLFSSNAGRRVLVARIKQRLPAISVS